MELSRWEVFSNLSPDLISEVRLAYTWGSARGGFIVTNNDDVYCVGGNKCELEFVKKIDVLCGEGIQSFHSGREKTLALTTSGQLWSIGDSLKAVLVIGSINQVAVGKHHVLALNSDGKVFSWGSNSFGELGIGKKSSSISYPQYVNIKCNIVSVACSSEASFALTREGDVLGWGRMGQNGHSRKDLYSPRILLQYKSVSQIVCGRFQGLALTRDGKLYGWGWEMPYNGQSEWEPREICTQIRPIAEIAGSNHNEFFACRTASQKIFVWGNWSGIIQHDPVQTNYKSVDEAFGCFKVPTMWRTVVVQSPLYSKMLKFHECALNDEETSDVEFLVDGEKIFAHRVFLKFRVPYFRTMFENNWKDSSKRVIEVENFTYDVFSAFITYVYTEKVAVKTSTDLYELLEAADYYNVQELLTKCENLLKTGMHEGNVCTVYTLAVRHNAKNLQMYAREYIIPRLSRVVKSNDFLEMDPHIKNQLIIRTCTQEETCRC